MASKCCRIDVTSTSRVCWGLSEPNFVYGYTFGRGNCNFPFLSHSKYKSALKGIYCPIEELTSHRFGRTPSSKEANRKSQKDVKMAENTLRSNNTSKVCLSMRLDPVKFHLHYTMYMCPLLF